jgi:carbamoyltransferase
MWILGIAGSHNSAAALLKDGEVVVAIQAERLTRRKRQTLRLDRMTGHAGAIIQYCLAHAGIDLPNLEAIATCTPWDVTRPRFVLRSGASPAAASLPRFLTVPHHLAHAEYALHYSPLEPCLVLVCDGSGTRESQRGCLDLAERNGDLVQYVQEQGKESISAYRFDGANLELVYRIAYGPVDDRASVAVAAGSRRPRWLASLGHLWEWAALYCHGSSHEAGKVMGLAPFGDPGTHADLETLAMRTDGEMRIDLPALFQRFRSPNSAAADVTGERHYEDLAAHVQHVTNRFLVELVRFLQSRYGTGALCYSGGVALNSTTNEYLRRKLDLTLHMNGSCEDNGTAIGAALAAHHSLTGRRVPEEVTDYYGREYSEEEIHDSFRGCPGRVRILSRAELLDCASRALASGAVVGWFQGRSEFGPRALGNRSILADPRSEHIQGFLNRRVKRREAFRPYAPAVLEERADEFFEVDRPSPVMLRVVPVRGPALPAVTHVDGTARVQTVHRRQNELFYDLLKAFGGLTGVPVLLNTSFNVAGEPIVETPDDALRTFVQSDMDLLVAGNVVIDRRAGQRSGP